MKSTGRIMTMDNFISGKMTAAGEVTLPTEIIEKLALQEGDRLNFEVDDNGNVKSVNKVKGKSVMDLAGVLKSDVRYDMYEARKLMQEDVAKNVVAKLEEGHEEKD
jgi:bifunctional DNA-binding transcriptional regulator/antitoxin component of YhaV-PrlF toxin-antitoxin module